MYKIKHTEENKVLKIGLFTIKYKFFYRLQKIIKCLWKQVDGKTVKCFFFIKNHKMKFLLDHDEKE